MATKIGGGSPNINQIQTPQPAAQTNQTSKTTKIASQTVQSFEPSQATLSQQNIPQATTGQAKPGTFKAGLLHRDSLQIGNLLDGARQKLDKLGQQVSWRMGRIGGQISDLFKPSHGGQTRPPIAALYGVIRPGIGENPGQTKPPISTRPPIAALYGVIRPGIGENPGQTKPPGGELPPIQAMYGTIAPGPGNNTPHIAALYGALMPGGDDWKPPIQAKYGVVRPPVLQANNATQRN